MKIPTQSVQISGLGADVISRSLFNILTFILARVHRRTPSDTYSFPDYQPAIFLHSTPVITHLHILWTDTVFGRMLLAATDHGLAAVLFDNEDDTPITYIPEKHAQHLLKTRFPKAKCSMILKSAHFRCPGLFFPAMPPLISIYM